MPSCFIFKGIVLFHLPRTYEVFSCAVNICMGLGGAVLRWFDCFSCFLRHLCWGSRSVEVEPRTFALPGRCSTTELNPAYCELVFLDPLFALEN